MKKMLAILFVFLLMAGTWCCALAEAPQNAGEAETEQADVSPLTLDETELVLAKGKSIKLKPAYDVKEYGKSVKYTWQTSDKKVAVASKGVVKGVGAGTAVITCTAKFKDGTTAKAECTVEVYVPVSRASVSKSSMTLVAGKTSDPIAVKISPESAGYPQITWTSADTKIATVDAEGRVNGVKGGKTVVTGTLSEPGAAKQKSVKVQVTVTQGVTTIRFATSSLNVGKGKVTTLTPNVLPATATNKKLTWTSSNPKVATVTDGKIRGVSGGTCTITATAADGSGVKAECQVTVVQSVTSIKFSEKKVVVPEDGTTQLRVTVKPDNASIKNVRWSSDSSYVATVSSSGVVKGVNGGTCYITAEATDGSGKKARIKVCVDPKNPITLESIGFGVYQYNLLGLTIRNDSPNRTIKDFGFNLKLYDYSGNMVNGGSFSLGKQTTIGPNRTKTIKRTVYGVGQAYRVVITITSVTYSDGSTYYIPSSEQRTLTFRR